MKLHPSYIADLQTLTPLDNLWMKSSVPMFIDTNCTLPVDNPCSLEVITLADIRFKDNPTLTIIDSNGNELYVTQPILVDDSFASNAPATVDTSTTTGYFKRLRVNSTNEDGIDIRTGGSIAADQTIYAQTFTTGGQNVTGTKISAWDAHLTNTSNPHSTTFAQLGSKPTTLSGFGITDAVNSGIQYTNPTWLAGIDASTIKTGTIDPARLPALPGSSAPIVSGGLLADLTPEQQDAITVGTIVVTQDGRRWISNISVGDKTNPMWYTELADITPDWSVIANRPTNISTWQNDLNYQTAAMFSNQNSWTGRQDFTSITSNGLGDLMLVGASEGARVLAVKNPADTSSRLAIYSDGTVNWSADGGEDIGSLQANIDDGIYTDGQLTVKGIFKSTYSAKFNLATFSQTPYIGPVGPANAVATIGDITSRVAGFAPTAHTHTWADITSGKPTTLAGYGITDAATSGHNHDSTYFKLAAGSVHSTGTFTALYPTLAVGDGQYGMSALGGALNLYSVGGIKIYTRSGSADAVFAGNLWHSGNLGFGTSAGSMCQGNDSRLSDARTPTAHTHTFASLTSKPTTLAGYGITDAVGSSDSRLTDARTPNNNAALVQGNINNTGAQGKRTTGLGSTANALDGALDSGFYDTNATTNPNGSWLHVINSAHNNNYAEAKYQFQIAASFDNDKSKAATNGPFWGGEGYWVRTINTSGAGAWRKLWHSGNFDANRVTTLETRATNLENASNTYLTISSASSTYLSKATASSTYLPLAGGTMENDAVVTFNRVTDGESVKTAGSGWHGMRVSTSGTGVGAYSKYITPSLSGSYWAVQKRDTADYGTTTGCFAIEDSSAGNVNERFALYIEAGAGGIAQFNRRVKLCPLATNYSSVLFNSPSTFLGGIIMSGTGTDQTMMFAQVDSAGKFVRKTNINANALVLDGAINTGNGSVFGGDITVNSCAYTKYLRVNKGWTDALAARIGGDLALDGRLWAEDCSIDGGIVNSTVIGQWNTAWSRIASGRLCEDAYTGEDTLDWITRMNRGNHWGRIHGVHSAPSYFNYMLIRETTGTKYSVIGCAADGNWYVGAEVSNANLTTYNKIWTSADFSSIAVNRINNSDSTHGFTRLYRADEQSKYYLRHGWTTGQWYGNSWRLTCANDLGDIQSGISTVAINYADVGNTAYTLTSKGGSNNGANLDTGFMGNTCGLWAGSIDAPTGTTPFGSAWTWLQEWGHSNSGWRAQMGIHYFADSLAFRRKADGTWKPWRYVVTTDASGNLPTLKVPGGQTLTIDGSLLCNNTVSYTVTGSDLTGAGPYNIGDYSRNVVACPVATTIQLQTSTYSYFKIIHAIGGTVAVTATGGASIKRGSSGGSNTTYNIGAGQTVICGYTPGMGFWIGWLY